MLIDCVECIKKECFDCPTRIENEKFVSERVTSTDPIFIETVSDAMIKQIKIGNKYFQYKE